jgi:arylsulfatase A-like enzyme
MLTGKYPFQHRTTGKTENDIFLKENNTITKILTENDYHSIGITDCGILSSLNKFDTDFTEYINTSDVPYITPNFRLESIKDLIRTVFMGMDYHTYRINEIIKNRLKKINNQSFFLFVNYYNAHVPYNPPRPYKMKFIADHSLYNEKIKKLATGKNNLEIMRGNLKVQNSEWDVIQALYDGEIAYLDYRIGELIRFLKDKDLYDNTVMIFTSDHGEYLGEHGMVGHVFGLFDEILKVPLIISLPDYKQNGVRISDMVSNKDIYHTILDILNIKNKNSRLSLLNFEENKKRYYIYAENEYEASKEKLPIKITKRCKCIRTKSLKYINSPYIEEEELFDLRNDPTETNNVIEEYPHAHKELKRLLNHVTRQI